jgi:hypothetical protein
VREDHEGPLTESFWRQHLGRGTLYREFPVTLAESDTEIQPRHVDGLVVLDDPFVGPINLRHITDARRAPSLSGKNVIVIQTKEAILEPYVFGQALLSRELIRDTWDDCGFIRSVLLCVEDNPVLRPIVTQFPGVEVYVVEPHCGPRPVKRERLGPAIIDFSARNNIPLRPEDLAFKLRVDGLFASDLSSPASELATDWVQDKDITTVHSFSGSVGMHIMGEVIMAQRWLKNHGATSTQSFIICRSRDKAIEASVRSYLTVEDRVLAGRFYQVLVKPKR